MKRVGSHLHKDRIRSCYIAYPPGFDVGSLTEALDKLGVTAMDITDLEPGPVVLADAVQSQIGSSDALIAVLSGSRYDRYTLFQIGLGRGLGKPTVLITSRGAIVPAELNGLTRIRLDPRHRLGLEQAVGRALDIPRRNPPSLGDLALAARPLGSSVDDFLRRLTSASSSSDEEVIQILAGAFTAGGAVVEVAGRSEGVSPDLVVWQTELEATVGNPIVVEIKQRLDDPASATRQVLRYMSTVGAAFGLLLLRERSKAITPSRSGVVILGVERLLADLRVRSLPAVITNYRNATMHGLAP